MFTSRVTPILLVSTTSACIWEPPSHDNASSSLSTTTASPTSTSTTHAPPDSTSAALTTTASSPTTTADSPTTTGGPTADIEGTTEALTDPLPEWCGNGVVDPGETCDNGPQNSDNGDCTSICLKGLCGDGLLHNIGAGLEECDNGPDNGPSKSCKLGCKLNKCGDGDLGPDEACDDGNLVDLDACSNTCVATFCGDGTTQLLEECDDGNAVITDTCWPNCKKSQCGSCNSPRPNVLFLLDYSTSMNTKWDANQTRYTGVITGLIESLNDYALSQRINVAFMRYGHDPAPANPGTLIPNDVSGIMDGHKLDFSWTSDGTYVTCQHENLATLLLTVPPPLNGNLIGIGTWTKGALDRAAAIIQAQRAQFGEDKNFSPDYRIILITDGEWTNETGNSKLSPAAQNPALTADLLKTKHNVTTHVIALGDAAGKAFPDELAAAGGTAKAVQAISAPDFAAKLKGMLSFLDSLGLIPKDCSG